MKGIKAKIFNKLSNRDEEEKSLLKGASSSFIIKIIGAGLAFGVNVLLGRILGVEDYGAYTYVFSWVAILAAVLPLGFDNSLLRFIPEYNQSNNWTGLKGVLIFAFKSILFPSVAIVLIVVFGYFLLDTSNWNYTKELIFTGIIILPFLLVLTVVSKALIGFKKIIIGLIPNMIIVQVVVAGCVLLFYFYQKEVSAAEAMTAKLIGTITALAITLFYFIKTLPKSLKTATADKEYAYWLKTSIPMLLIAGIFVVLSKTDIIMIGSMLGKKEAGIYGAVVKVSALVLFGLQAVNIVVAPQISELYHAGKKEKLQKIITVANRMSFAIALFATVVFLFLGEFVLSLFGDSFTLGYSALIIFLVAYLFKSFSGSVGYIMTMTGHQNMSVKILGSSAVVNLVLNFILVPKWGINGAAVATGISMILWNVALIIYIKKKLNINATIF